MPQRGTDPGLSPELLCARVVNVGLGALVRRLSRVMLRIKSGGWDKQEADTCA